MSTKGSAFVALTALACGLAAAGCSNEEADKGQVGAGASAEETGSFGLNLTLSNGVEILEVVATITGGSLATPIVRTIPVPNDEATVSAFFGGLPQGDYNIELSAEGEDEATTCSGSADFSVLAGETVGVAVPLTCNTDSVRGNVTVDGQLNVCPELEFLFVAPLQTAVGGVISVEAVGLDFDENDTISYSWTATDGSFVDPSVFATTYNCSAPGDQTITLTINDGGDCASDLSVDVFCETSAVCGDGLLEEDRGEECEPPDGVVCSDTCQDIIVECGNSLVQPGEDCDPPDGTTCNAACESIVCGDGAVEGSEECEPPGTDTCDASCQGIVLCGNGALDAGEDCDPPEAGVCENDCSFPVGAECDMCREDSCSGPVSDVATQCVDGVCDAYLACQESSGCAEGDSRVCYCGTVDPAVCFNSFTPGSATGPCAGVIETLAGTTIPLQVGQFFFDSTGPLGAVGQLNLCTNNNCSGQCF